MNKKNANNGTDNIFSIDYGFDVTILKKREEKIAEQLEFVKCCNDEDVLLDIVRDYDKDVSVRIAACDKITTEYKLNYLLAASTVSRTREELIIALHLVPKIVEEELINDTMQDFLFSTYLAATYSELTKKAISCVTNISILEKFIRHAESTGRIGSSVIESAYNRLIELSEKE